MQRDGVPQPGTGGFAWSDRKEKGRGVGGGEGGVGGWGGGDLRRSRCYPFVLCSGTIDLHRDLKEAHC